MTNRIQNSGLRFPVSGVAGGRLQSIAGDYNRLLWNIAVRVVCLFLLCSTALAQEKAPAEPAGDTSPTDPDSATEGSASSDEGANDAPELTEAADLAIDRGLQYLLATQRKDGSWASESHSGLPGKIAIGGTSLGLMAFMVRGHFPGFGPHGDALDRAKDFLLEQAKQSKSGAMGGMYEHGLFTLAMSELWGMTADTSDNAAIKEALQKAVDVILRAQSPMGGWRYAPRPDAGNDTSVTAMVFISLASARQAGILVPTATIDNVVSYLRDVAYGGKGFGYTGRGYTVACTAGGTYAAQLCGKRDTEWVQTAVRSLQNHAGIFEGKGVGAYYYTHYYAIQAMVQAGDEHYAQWYPRIRDALIARQNPDGSWAGGMKSTVHVTPMAIIILGTPYRYIPVYQR